MSSATINPAVISRRRSRSLLRASTRERPMLCSLVRRARANPRQRRGSLSRGSDQRSCWHTTKPSRPSSQPSFATLCPIMRSSTLCRITTTINPRHMCRRPTPLSKRTPPSTLRSSDYGIQRPIPSSVVAVSCIYGLGAPEEYLKAMMPLRVGQRVDRDWLIRKFVSMQYSRNDVAFDRGTFRVRGDTLEIIPVYEEHAIRIEMFGDEIEALYSLHPLTGNITDKLDSVPIFPGSHYITTTHLIRTALRQRALGTIRDELDERLSELKRNGKLLEAQRLQMRTTFDLEMMEQIGFCSGIENYSRHMDGRSAGEAPHCLLDYFPDDFLVVIDESHATVPQIGAMFEGDSSRKRVLVEHGFRLPSAMDNRPLKWDEFKARVGQTVYLSATPGKYELGTADGVVEQIIRPTGLVDPQIVVKPSKGQIDDLLEEIRLRTERDERVLVTTLTKRMAEELTAYLGEAGVRVRDLHSDGDTPKRRELITALGAGGVGVRYLDSDVDTLKCVELLTELRAGVYDVLVGINLLREGLDLPEVSLVAILDADKEGFLRSATSLIQTIGRAARNVSGEVHMYADKITDSMAVAIEETTRRREKQVE